MPFIQSISFDSEAIQAHSGYPFSLALFQSLHALAFPTPVTLFVGENGTGKSTLLSAIAASIPSVTVGGDSIASDHSLAPSRELARCLRIIWKLKTKRGFYLRSEDFINFTRHIESLKDEMEDAIREVDETYANRSDFARSLAKMPYAGSLHALKQSYGDGLEKQSHGESYLSLFQSRFVPEGVYLLDEPETPLSPLKQLALISMLKDMEKQGSQFIIATHSPILMAYPGATIYSFDHAPIHPVPYHQLEHVNLTRDFLNAPERFLRHL